jgi:hypothetical protein
MLEARRDKGLPQLHRGHLHLSKGLYTLREKARCCEYYPVDGHKLHPAHARLVPLWSRIDVVAAQDVAHRNLVDMIPHVRQGSLDTAVAPRRVFLSHPHHECFKRDGHSRSSRLRVRRCAMTLLGDKAPIPAMQGLHSDDGGDGLGPFSVDRMSQYGKTAAVGISEAESTALVFRFEDAIFFNEISDSLCLVPVEPSGEPGDQGLENHSPTSGGKSRHHGLLQYMLNLGDIN